MLGLLNIKPGSQLLGPGYVIGPRQILSNCWLNSFFMCYFISDKGRKFFRHLRRTMITGEKVKGGKKIQPKYKAGLWLLNKTIQAGLGWSENSENFIINADTNDIIRLLRGSGRGDQKKIMETKKPHNPMRFYNELFEILGLEKGVKYIELNHKLDYYNIIKKYNSKASKIKGMMDCYKDMDLIIIHRRDDPGKNGIDSGKMPPPKSFTYFGKKFILD